MTYIRGPASPSPTRFDHLMDDGGTTPPIPAWKAQWFAARKQDQAWQDMHQAMAQDPNRDATERRIFGEIFAAEGGMVAPDSSSAVDGILTPTLQGLVKNGRLPDEFAHGFASGLQPEDIPVVYRAYFDDALAGAGGHKTLRRLDPQAGFVLRDTLFRFGGHEGARMVQQAVNDAVGQPRLKVDGVFGPKSFDAFQMQARDPAMRERLFNGLEEIKDDMARDEKPRNRHWRTLDLAQ